ncbi:MAG: uridine kinase [Candidatus Cloacimonadales bacterium]
MHLILIGGGTSSGKTTIAKQITGQLDNELVYTFSHDNYYFDLTHLTQEDIKKINFDHPDAIDSKRLISDVKKILRKEEIHIPDYDFITHKRIQGEFINNKHDVIILEGIFALYYPELIKLASLKIFVDTDADLRLARRIERDINERGFTINDVLAQYINTVKPMHDVFIEGTKKQADIIIPGEKKFDRVLVMINGFLKELLR